MERIAEVRRGPDYDYIIMRPNEILQLKHGEFDEFKRCYKPEPPDAPWEKL